MWGSCALYGGSRNCGNLLGRKSGKIFHDLIYIYRSFDLVIPLPEIYSSVQLSSIKMITETSITIIKVRNNQKSINRELSKINDRSP